MNNKISYDRFVGEYYGQLHSKPSFIRKGQLLMNILGENWLDEYKRITNTPVDCFYNDKIIPDTLKHLEQVWPK